MFVYRRYCNDDPIGPFAKGAPSCYLTSSPCLTPLTTSEPTTTVSTTRLPSVPSLPQRPPLPVLPVLPGDVHDPSQHQLSRTLPPQPASWRAEPSGPLMPASFARFIVRRHRLVLLGALLFVLVSGALGGSVAGKLSNGGFDDPTAESSTARKLIEQTFGAGSPNLVLLVTANSGSVDDPAATTAGLALADELSKEPGVTGVASYWSLQAPPLKSRSGDQALVLARITGSEDDIRLRIEDLSPRFSRPSSAGSNTPIAVTVTGEAEVFRQVGETIEKDLTRAETIALPITLLLLIIVFGGLVAAGLPLLVGAVTVLGTFLVLTIINSFTDVSIFALNLTTALGLGLAIDYALFIVSRYREELDAGWPVADALVRSIRTAGRTVVFSAATVAISLSALLVFRQAFLRSFAFAGIAVAAIAALSSVVVLPAVLALLGTRINSLRIGRRRNTARSSATTDDGFWHRSALAVMKRPGRIAAAGIAGLLVLGIPFLHINLGLSDHRVLPTSATARKALDSIATNFDSRENGAAEIFVRSFDPTNSANVADLGSYAAAVSSVSGVARVDALTGSYIGGRQVAPANQVSQRFAGTAGVNATWMSIVPSVEPISQRGEQFAKEVRAVPSPFSVLVGGPSAQLVDSKASLIGRLPWAGGIIALVTFVLLFLMFGGLLVPVKAVLLNLLSLTATFGAMVWIFQDGHLSESLGFTPTGTIDATTPVLMFCIAFGLSMDYEVFLLSRIKEEHDRHGDNSRAVAVGLEKTGRIVTAAALLIAIVFVAFATSGVSFIKLFGLGLALAVLMDAFVIRSTLVPAFMKLAGEANWWAPAPLRTLQQRIGLSEHVELESFPMPPCDDSFAPLHSDPGQPATESGQPESVR